MSLDAQKWAYQADVVSGARFILVVLGDHAGDHRGEDWTCYPGMARIAEMVNMSVKSVERHLKLLIKEGWISRTRKPGRAREDGLYLYTLHRAKRPQSPVKLSDEQVRSPDNLTGDQAHEPPDKLSDDDADHRTICDRPSDNLSPTIGQSESFPPHPPYKAEPSVNPHPTKAGAGMSAGFEIFETVLAEWIAAAKNSRTEPDAAEAAWERAACDVDMGELSAAARLALAQDPDFKRRGPPGLQRWLAEKRYVNWLGKPGAATPARTRFADETVRAAIVTAKGESYAGSWLDPAQWDVGARTITPKTLIAGTTLRRDCSGVLQRLGVRVVDFVKA